MLQTWEICLWLVHSKYIYVMHWLPHWCYTSFIYWAAVNFEHNHIKWPNGRDYSLISECAWSRHQWSKCCLDLTHSPMYQPQACIPVHWYTCCYSQQSPSCIFSSDRDRSTIVPNLGISHKCYLDFSECMYMYNEHPHPANIMSTKYTSPVFLVLPPAFLKNFIYWALSIQ